MEAVEPVELKTSLLTLMHQGGWVMWALLLFSIVALASAIERSLALRKAGTDLEPYLSRLRQSLLKTGSVAEALEVSEATPGIVPRVAETGLRRFSRSTAQLEKSLERRAQGEVQRLHRGLGILATTATTAPLLGFLGTVTGMMASFQALADLGITDPGAVAAGIKEKGKQGVLLFGGGIIPEDDIPGLKDAGFAAIFLPGTDTGDVISFINDNLG